MWVTWQVRALQETMRLKHQAALNPKLLQHGSQAADEELVRLSGKAST